MDNPYQWVPFYEALADTFDIKPSVSRRHADTPTLEGRSLFITAVDKVWEEFGF